MAHHSSTLLERQDGFSQPLDGNLIEKLRALPDDGDLLVGIHTDRHPARCSRDPHQSFFQQYAWCYAGKRYEQHALHEWMLARCRDQPTMEELKRITRQRLQDGSRSRNALTMFWRRIANRYDLLGVRQRVRGFASICPASKHARVARRSLTPTLVPLPGSPQGSTEALSELLSTLFWMFLQQLLEHRSVCSPVLLLHHFLL